MKYPELSKDLKGEEFREMYGSGFMRVLTSPSRAGCCVSTLIPKRVRSFHRLNTEWLLVGWWGGVEMG